MSLNCLLETEWEQIGWGPLGTVGLCGSCPVSINKAKLSDGDSLTTFSRSEFHGVWGFFGFWLIFGFWGGFFFVVFFFVVVVVFA